MKWNHLIQTSHFTNEVKCYEAQIQNNLPKIKPLVSGRLERETHILVTF